MNYVSITSKLRRKGFEFSAELEIKSRVTGVFGPSGSGKTTFMHLLAGLQKPDEGKIEINGTSCFNSQTGLFVPAHKRKVGYVFQEGRIFPHMSIAKNLRYGCKKKEFDQKYYDELVKILGLESLLNKHPGQLSGGQNQRVAIGRALLSNANLLLLDEPFTALDAHLKKQVISLLNKIIRRLDIPVIIVSHELKDLLMLTKDIILLKDGKADAPESYCELIRHERLLKFNGLIKNYYNVFEAHISSNAVDKGLSFVELREGRKLQLAIENDECHYRKNEIVNISLRGADVALSVKKPEQISIRNQLPGTVESLIRNHNHLVCIVDCGIKIITRLTLESAKELKLEKGKPVWCLFKSLAIDAYA